MIILPSYAANNIHRDIDQKLLVYHGNWPAPNKEEIGDITRSTEVGWINLIKQSKFNHILTDAVHTAWTFGCKPRVRHVGPSGFTARWLPDYKEKFKSFLQQKSCSNYISVCSLSLFCKISVSVGKPLGNVQ